ncbi:uracil phosphoribosyltransferase [Caldisphaera lagunensis DSM 15908]|uniref:Uracil phosphoribosyltransferase n=1 Tax=Caldisphaera lagunensis (strain DSM 15908 / JCM 11604 / ANMR 0165 / IC-154) TaxID=1056495 RepID=L0A998_CALLD|nr:uracil phosphoribosyltransferase [Caldisphaera lagunensis DSM 15908]
MYNLAKIKVLGEELPIARYLLKKLRDKNTSLSEFRKAMSNAGKILAIESSRELMWRQEKVITPLNQEAVELELINQPLLVGILGAALPLMEGFIDIYPDAPIGLVAAKRNEIYGSINIDIYYKRLPERYDEIAYLIDPMLATGKTMDKVIDELYKRGIKKIIIASVISSKPGINYLLSLYDNLVIYSLSIDNNLDDNFFIIPGLGDAGDRGLGIEPH